MMTLEERETLVFVKLENQVESGRLFDVYFAPENRKCKLHDAGGEAAPERQITDSCRRWIEHRRPTSCWVTLPDL